MLADALTSVLAIFALLTGKYLGWNFMDPLMGIVGAILVSRWSLGLLRDTSQVLLDTQAPDDIVNKVTESIERDGDAKVTDIHIWSIGPGIYAAEVTVASDTGKTSAAYREQIPADLGIVHLVVEAVLGTTPEG